MNQKGPRTGPRVSETYLLNDSSSTFLPLCSAEPHHPIVSNPHAALGRTCQIAPSPDLHYVSLIFIWLFNILRNPKKPLENTVIEDTTSQESGRSELIVLSSFLFFTFSIHQWLHLNQSNSLGPSSRHEHPTNRWHRRSTALHQALSL